MIVTKALADLRFFRGGDFGNPSERSERAFMIWLEEGTKRHRNNLSHTHNNNMK